MATTKRPKSVRRSITLSPEVRRKVERMARHEKRSASQVLENLVESGLAAEEAKRRQFYDLVERFRAADDPNERQRLGNELGRAVFGS